MTEYSPDYPLEVIIEEIQTAVNAGAIYAAIHLALSLPDICSALETSADERKRFKIEERYVEWCKHYLEPKFSRFTAEDCWAMRGGLIHNGMLFGHPKAQFGRIIFTLPDSSGNTFQITMTGIGAPSNNAMMLDVVTFLRNIVKATHEWFDANKGNEKVLASLPNLVRPRPEGLAPFVIGMPVIA